ncbi:MAG TPA: hypothetical protein PK453_19945 [Leptospiraceae bacterium]|nr:hypothetical protein [Leptospiraceae bacterium]HNM05698.1 hypothetical protein [Leptospiraceae bacterium]
MHSPRSKRTKYYSKGTGTQSLYLFGVEFKDKNVGEWVMEEVG